MAALTSAVLSDINTAECWSACNLLYHVHGVNAGCVSMEFRRVCQTADGCVRRTSLLDFRPTDPSLSLTGALRASRLETAGLSIAVARGRFVEWRAVYYVVQSLA